MQKNITVPANKNKNTIYPQEGKMKLIIAVVLSLGLTSTASAGLGDFFKTKEISKRMLNVVQKNHLVVAKVKHPAEGLALFDACFNGQNFVSKTNTNANRCVEFEYELDQDRRSDVIGKYANLDVLTQDQYNDSHFRGYYIPKCSKWEQYTPSGSVNRTTSKEVNCRWVKGMDLPSSHPRWNEEGESGTLYRLCDREPVATTFPLTQTIEVYNLQNNFSNKVYWNEAAHADDAHPGYRKFFYTIPMCDALGKDDIPDTKK